ncbi:MAG TPA: GAF domain-containing protein [Bacteroidales bacterium]|jgi:hypothetical protein|nr:GAF domain-containing protein [Bacteroidales bacterium]
MINLSKYRKLSVLAVIILVITWLSSMAAFWNTLLTTDAKNEGWVVLFMSTVLFTGMLLFYFAYVAADPVRIENIRKEAFESGKSGVIQEFERKKQSENKQQVKDEDIKKVTDAVLSGINSARSASGICNKLLACMAHEMGFVQGVMYLRNQKDAVFNPCGEYALTDRKPEPFKDGETLAGQAVSGKSITVIHDIPENYFKISSGLGSSAPKYLLLAPVVYNNETIAVLELAAFRKPDESMEKIMEMIFAEAGPKINKFIAAQS